MNQRPFFTLRWNPHQPTTWESNPPSAMDTPSISDARISTAVSVLLRAARERYQMRRFPNTYEPRFLMSLLNDALHADDQFVDEVFAHLARPTPVSLLRTKQYLAGRYATRTAARVAKEGFTFRLYEDPLS